MSSVFVGAELLIPTYTVVPFSEWSRIASFFVPDDNRCHAENVEVPETTPPDHAPPDNNPVVLFAIVMNF